MFYSNDFANDRRTPAVVKRVAAAGRRWDEETFFRSIAERGATEDEALAKRLLGWARQRNLQIDWGRGRILGAFYPFLVIEGTLYPQFGTWTDSTVEIQFWTPRRRRQFESEQSRLELLRRLNEIPSVQIDPIRITGNPKIPFATLRTDDNLEKFLEVIDVRRHYSAC